MNRQIEVQLDVQVLAHIRRRPLPVGGIQQVRLAHQNHGRRARTKEVQHDFQVFVCEG